MAGEDSSSRVSQSKIDSGGGDVAGGDIQKTYFNNQYADDSHLNHLYSQLSSEIKENLKIEDICEILEDFIATDEDEVIGLEQKLEDGGMQSQYGYARESKESYVKNLTRYSMYETAQCIHAYCLSKVQSGYVSDVLPHLQSTPSGEKFRLMRKAVLDALEAKMGRNPLRLYSKEIDGMAFFLTGKCKLKWS